MIKGDVLIAFCDSFTKIEKLTEAHGHNWQRVKGIYGNPAICIIDTPCFVNKDEKLVLK